MHQIIIAIIISYLVGSIPTAYVFGRLLKGVDIRKSGSGNVGATNAFRVLGKSAGIMVLILDIVKGLFCVVVVGNFAVLENIAVSDLLVRVILGAGCFNRPWYYYPRPRVSARLSCFSLGSGICSIPDCFRCFHSKQYSLSGICIFIETTLPNINAQHCPFRFYPPAP